MFCLTMFHYNVEKKTLATVCVEFSCSHPVCMSFSGSSSFFPHPKEMDMRLIDVSILSKSEYV